MARNPTTAPNPDEPAAAEKKEEGAFALTSLEQLAEIANKPRTLNFDIGGRQLSLVIKPLNSEQVAELEKIDGAINPPKDQITKEANLDDPVYQRKLAHARRLKRTAALNLGLVSFKIPGEDLEEQMKLLYKTMPPGVIDALWTKLLEITASPVENALFASSDGSL